MINNSLINKYRKNNLNLVFIRQHYLQPEVPYSVHVTELAYRSLVVIEFLYHRCSEFESVVEALTARPYVDVM